MTQILKVLMASCPKWFMLTALMILLLVAALTFTVVAERLAGRVERIKRGEIEVDFVSEPAKLPIKKAKALPIVSRPEPDPVPSHR